MRTPIARRSRRSSSNQSGQGMLEYVLIVVFIAVAGIVVWRTFGGEVKSLVTESSDAVSAESDKIFKEYKKTKNR